MVGMGEIYLSVFVVFADLPGGSDLEALTCSDALRIFVCCYLARCGTISCFLCFLAGQVLFTKHDVVGSLLGILCWQIRLFNKHDGRLLAWAYCVGRICLVWFVVGMGDLGMLCCSVADD